MIRTQLVGCPAHQRVLAVLGGRPGKCDKLALAVAPHQRDAIPKADQAIENLDRLRAGGDVTGDDDPLRGPHLGFGKHRVECREHPVNVGENGNRHLASVQVLLSSGNQRSRRAKSACASYRYWVGQCRLTTQFGASTISETRSSPTRLSRRYASIGSSPERETRSTPRLAASRAAANRSGPI